MRLDQRPGHSTRRTRRRQRGMTAIGVFFVLVMVGLIAYGGMRLVPAYLNYIKVSRSLDETASELKTQNPDLGAIRNSLEKHWQIEDITIVEPKDVEISRDENGVSLHLAYDDTEPYVGNVSLSVHFDKTVKVQ